MWTFEYRPCRFNEHRDPITPWQRSIQRKPTAEAAAMEAAKWLAVKAENDRPIEVRLVEVKGE